jgi:hypothetical protein
VVSNEAQTNNWRDYRDHVLGGGNNGCCWVVLSGCGGVSCGGIISKQHKKNRKLRFNDAYFVYSAFYAI